MLADLVRVAGIRWVVESCFEAATGEVGLEHYEGRSWTGWDHQSTLTMLALALLTMLRAGALAVEPLKKSLPPARAQSSLTAFKGQRGFASRYTSRRCAGCFGASSWLWRRVPSTLWRG